MKKIIATIVCTMCTAVICAQLAWLSVDKQPLAGTYSRNFQQLLTAQQNQAALAYVPVLSAGISTERRFMLQALSMHTLALAIPVKNGGSFGLHLAQSGHIDYKQQSVGFAYGRKLGDRLSIGMQIDYYSHTIPGYLKAGAMAIELGFLMHFTPELHGGVHIVNPTGSRLWHADKERLPVIYNAGLGYELSPSFILSTALVQQTGADIVTRVMCEYRIIKQLSFHAGVSTAAQQNNAAISIYMKQLHLLLSTAYHAQLGITPAIAILWQLKTLATATGKEQY